MGLLVWMLIIGTIIHESRVVVSITLLIVLLVDYGTLELFEECLVELRLARLKSKLLIHRIKF